jgi:hypothetical protein
MMLLGSIENWNILIDIEKMGLTSAPKNEIQAIIKAINMNFKSTTKKTFIVNTTWFFDVIFKIVKGFLNPLTKEKIDVSKNCSTRSMKEMYDPS